MGDTEMSNEDEEFLERIASEFMDITFSIMKTETNMELKPLTFQPRQIITQFNSINISNFNGTS